tara:strand:- start:130 stop:1005 length:876 start_codon:yes stop_codon:yes gene_type:complete
MEQPLLLSGKEVSKQVYKNLQEKIIDLKNRNIIPGLAVVLVGENPASKIYVRSKTKIFNKLELKAKTFHLDVETSEVELVNLISKLNNDVSYHGILVQLPLPKHINSSTIINSIDPEKDVDGFHPENAGLLSIGKPRFIPCTPKGIMRILEYYNISLNGKHVVVLGRSNIVGRPISILTSLKSKFSNATTTICHSGTKDIEKYTKNADVIIAALGIPEFLKKNMVKNRSVIIDVGINRIDADNQKGYNIVGDTKFDDLKESVSAITPVPGGVGPMTIAMLVENTIEASEIL